MAVTAFPDEWLAQSLEGLITPELLQQLREKSESGRTLWECVVAEKIATDTEIIDKLSHRFRLKVADASKIDPAVRDGVPEQLARRYRVLPIRLTDSYLELGTANPFDLDAEKALAFATAREIRLFLLAPSKISEKLDEMYKPDKQLNKLLEGMEGSADLVQLNDAPEELNISEADASQKPVVRLVDMIISEGILSRASDIHVEPEEGGVAVRYRIDGVLRQVMKIPRQAGLPLISRIKIMSSLDIADRLRPQDGRARVAVNGQPIDLRVSTLPAQLGEKVVIRILDSRATVKSLDSLGLNPGEAEAIKRLLENHEGILLVTGPTGSGKTTTLYSAINQIKSEGVNIVTVEDPVEYRMQGIVQVQVQEKAGLTFAAALRSILRQDPNVVLVGEIRDKETAQIAVQASLTGHLVLSTLHTNDAANAVTRLVDIGVEAYKIAASLRGVVAQRLMRKLCTTCKEVWMEAPPERLRRWIPSGTPLYRAAGCPDCAMTGYRGRFSILEILTMTAELERRIAAGEAADRIAEAARRGGMKSLWDSGLAHVTRGESTIEELTRVVDIPAEDEGAAPEEKPRATGGKRVSGSAEALRFTPMPGSLTAPPEPPAPVSTHFDLLEEHAPPARRSGAHGQPASKVLLVDDEDSLRKVMKDLLERDGYVVTEARDGVQALDQVDRVGPDIIVLDLNLPGLDGYGVLSHLRSRPATANIPVIVLTAKGDEDNEVRVFELGADDFLTKPFRARALSARLEAVLGRRR
ncbi:MAG TPA: type II/IV secretion system protein [Gemmatimonadales bacterium]|jgi:type II secretory ATPase GspE/PulE/Tfp pilus assembly ATPase PilB-like protein/CheY-like chemotaxis protein|nr:type II/IV secretion system protein [Gemmatimonadales bacterium]